MKSFSPTRMSFPGAPRSATGILRYTVLAAAIVWVFFYLRSAPFSDSLRTPSTLRPQNPTSHETQTDLQPPAQEPTKSAPSTHEETHNHETDHGETSHSPANVGSSAHPIDELIETADKDFQALLKKESKDLNSAAAEYRKRRGRHPPPGFDAWFKFAKDNNAVIVEEFFDQVYHDIGPFWGLSPAQMRRDASEYEMTIKIRNHKATAGSDWFWTKIWLNLTQTIEQYLPDMDLALNAMDEPRVLLPWEEINKHMEKERASRSMPPARDVITEYQKLALKPDENIKKQELNFEKDRPFWKLASRGCPPDSLARKAVQMSNFSHTPDISLKYSLPFMHKGYISNFTLSSDFCNQPDIQSLHGMMINPLSVSTTKTLIPMFGGSKLPTNNEILLPAPMYWNNEERFSGGNDHGPPWAEKEDKVIWRGIATGGLNTADNWRGFQRHRFVSQTNGTEISNVENWKQVPLNWALPPPQYNLAAQQEGKLGEWTKKWSDTGFIGLMCNKKEAEPGDRCKYTGPYFDLKLGLKMAQQFACKYVPDIDGNSFSGRYRGFLMSTSLPIKATIFREWHDSRLVPWKHFVPMDNRFVDFWGIMEYFLGYEGKDRQVPGHDKVAEKMALDGQSWANKVLRPEDMQIYVFRVLLEYARVTDDNREKMGWVKDLL